MSLTHEDKEHLIGLILKEWHCLHTINAGIPMGEQMVKKIEKLEDLKRKLQHES